MSSEVGTVMSLNIHCPVSAVQKTGTLVIENITESDFGSYVCTAQNMVGTAICDLEFYAGKPFVFKHFLEMLIRPWRNREENGWVEILLFSGAGATNAGKLDSNDVGYIAAIVLGIVLGLVLIGVAIWLIVRAVKKKKYKGVQQTDGTQMRWKVNYLNSCFCIKSSHDSANTSIIYTSSNQK